MMTFNEDPEVLILLLLTLLLLLVVVEEALVPWLMIM
jgi:hypothetical protein